MTTNKSCVKVSYQRLEAVMKLIDILMGNWKDSDSKSLGKELSYIGGNMNGST